jgi:cobalt-precorrin 5A hydrolase
LDRTDPGRVALVVLTGNGLTLALRVQQGLETDTHIYASERALKTRSAAVGTNAITSFDSLGSALAQLWESHDQLVLFFALGAAIRLLAPLLRDKHRDPGVVVIDDASNFAISTISGHAGGANDLARRCARLLGAIPVITTASDVHHTLSVDLLAETMGWRIADPSQITTVSASIINGEPVAILQDAGPRDWWDSAYPWPANLIRINALDEVTSATFAALLIISDRRIEDVPNGLPTVIYRPPSLILGIGCRRGVPFAALDTFIKTTVLAHDLAFESIAVLASADLKADEVALQQLSRRYSWRFETYPIEALQAVTTIATPSERVQRLIGTPSVSEAAALLSAHNGQLIVPKHKGEGMTLAIARKENGR